MRLVDRLHVIQGVHKGRDMEIAMEIHQVDSTYRTLLLYHTLDIRPMGIEVVGCVNNKNHHPLARRRGEGRHSSIGEQARRALRCDQKQ